MTTPATTTYSGQGHLPKNATQDEEFTLTKTTLSQAYHDSSISTQGEQTAVDNHRSKRNTTLHILRTPFPRLEAGSSTVGPQYNNTLGPVY